MPYIRSRDGARIFYRVHGPRGGEPLVLIMGLGWDMTGWQLLVPALSRYRTLRLDNRGTGRSDKPDRPYSIPLMAGDVIRCMNDAGFTRAHVYGGSLGGMIAQEIAISYPGRVRTLILGCTSPGVVSFPPSPFFGRAVFSRQPLTPEESFMRIAPMLYGSALEERPEAVEEVMQRRIASNVSPVGLRRQLEAILRWSSLFRLHQVKAPTLVIHGDRDKLIRPVNGRIIARLIPGARLAVIRGAGHIYGTDRPEEHLDLLLTWLEDHSDPKLRAAG